MSRELQDVKRIVLKVGTNLLSSKDGIDELCIDSIVEQIALLMQKNYQVLLVTSGADRKSTRLNSSHRCLAEISRMPSSA